MAISRYAPGEQQVWALSSVLVLVGLAGLIVAMARTPEYRTKQRRPVGP